MLRDTLKKDDRFRKMFFLRNFRFFYRSLQSSSGENIALIAALPIEMQCVPGHLDAKFFFNGGLDAIKPWVIEFPYLHGKVVFFELYDPLVIDGTTIHIWGGIGIGYRFLK